MSGTSAIPSGVAAPVGALSRVTILLSGFDGVMHLSRECGLRLLCRWARCHLMSIRMQPDCCIRECSRPSSLRTTTFDNHALLDLS